VSPNKSHHHCGLQLCRTTGVADAPTAPVVVVVLSILLGGDSSTGVLKAVAASQTYEDREGERGEW